MATLQKIRNKSWLLFVIITLALLAFILGDLLDSRRSIFFSAGARDMAKVGSVKVDYDNYRKTYEDVRSQGQQYNDAVVEQQVVQQLLMQQLLEEEYDKLGIQVTDEEISRIMMSPASAYMMQPLASNLGVSDPRAIYDMVCNPAKYNLPASVQEQLTQIWANLEKQAEESLKTQAYLSLVSGLFTANELDAKSRYADNNDRMAIEYAAVNIPFGNPETPVSDAELKSMWESHKENFSTFGLAGSNVKEPVRAIEYISVVVNPSSSDIQAARDVVSQGYADLKDNEGIAGLVDAPGFIRNAVSAPRANVRARAGVAAMPDSLLKVNGTYMSPFNSMNNTFTLAKVTGVNAKVDSVKVSMFIAKDAAENDSVLGVLNAGASFAELAQSNPGQVVEDYLYLPQSDLQPGQNEAVLLQILNIDEVNSGVYSNPIGKTTAYTDTVTGLNLLYKVNDRNNPKDYVEMQVFTYNVDPSAETRSELRNGLASFVASNNNAKSFVAAADTTPQFAAMRAFVSASTPYIGSGYNYFDNTRKVVKWAMDAKSGQVSPIFDVRTLKNPNMPNVATRDVYMVAALTDVLDGNYVPYNSSLTRADLEAMVRADKAAKELIDQYAGKASTVAEYANLMNATVASDSAAVFTTAMRQDPVIAGSMAAAAPNTVVGPVQGMNQIVVFTVNPVDSEARPYTYAADAMDYINTFGFPVSRQTGMIDQTTLLNMLIGNREYKNQTLNVVSAQDEE
ncbi:MAG: SurA N-terminal domain-containing protein [Clostridium sp.]|nr:SurA N-terminal domain-containing protein [Clostridium sp.]